jgi:hypothetical protein
VHWIDATQLPVTTGTIERFIVDLRGEPDGIVLRAGGGLIKLVNFPSQMADEVKAVLKPGDSVGIRGLKLRAADVIAAVAIECPNGVQILDHGPSKQAEDAEYKSHTFRSLPMSVSGKIRLTIFTTKGKVRGALLEDGTIVRMSLKLAAQISKCLQPGEIIQATGVGHDSPHGRIIEVHHFGTQVGRFVVVNRSKGVRHSIHGPNS